MPSKHARHWTAEEKLRILEEGRQAGSSISEVCRRHQIAPGQFYLWEKQAKQGALQALRNSQRGRKPPMEIRLRAEVERLRTVVAELSIENLQLKKTVTQHRRYPANEKALILETVEKTQALSGQSVEQILSHLSLSPATYYRWKERETEERLTDRIVPSRRRPLPPTPEEVQAVEAFALAHPQVGYKRLAWEMVDEDIAYLRPTQVYDPLNRQGLLARRLPPPAEALRRPKAPDHADQVWHMDLTYLSEGSSHGKRRHHRAMGQATSTGERVRAAGGD